MPDFQIIDAHVHPFLDERTRTCIYGIPATPEEMVKTLREAGVVRCCGSTIIPGADGSLEQLKEENRISLAFRDRFPDFFDPGIMVNACFPEESCREIENMYRQGARWVGELVGINSGSGRIPYSGSGFFPAYDLAQQYGLPVNIHQDNMDDIEPIVRNFPKLNVVMAHPDEKRTYMKRLALMKQYKNLYLDLSGTGLFRWGMLRYGVGEVGAERFLFGSDFPICNAAMNAAAVCAEYLTDEQKQLIFSGNYLRLTQAAGR